MKMFISIDMEGVPGLDEIDPRCRVVRGAGRPTATTMTALDPSIGVVLLVGHHARAGSRPGIMAHTVSVAGDMDLGFQRIAYCGYGHHAGVVRY